MRCLFVADLHYSLPQFDWLLKAAAGYDLVVLAGDALDISSIVDFRAQTLVIGKYLHRLAGVTRLIVCSGNHDLVRCAGRENAGFGSTTRRRSIRRRVGPAASRSVARTWSNGSNSTVPTSSSPVMSTSRHL